MGFTSPLLLVNIFFLALFLGYLLVPIGYSDANIYGSAFIVIATCSFNLSYLKSFRRYPSNTLFATSSLLEPRRGSFLIIFLIMCACTTLTYSIKDIDPGQLLSLNTLLVSTRSAALEGDGLEDSSRIFLFLSNSLFATAIYGFCSLVCVSDLKVLKSRSLLSISCLCLIFVYQVTSGTRGFLILLTLCMVYTFYLKGVGRSIRIALELNSLVKAKLYLLQVFLKLLSFLLLSFLLLLLYSVVRVDSGLDGLSWYYSSLLRIDISHTSFLGLPRQVLILLYSGAHYIFSGLHGFFSLSYPSLLDSINHSDAFSCSSSYAFNGLIKLFLRSCTVDIVSLDLLAFRPDAIYTNIYSGFTPLLLDLGFLGGIFISIIAGKFYALAVLGSAKNSNALLFQFVIFYAVIMLPFSFVGTESVTFVSSAIIPLVSPLLLRKKRLILER